LDHEAWLAHDLGNAFSVVRGCWVHVCVAHGDV